MISSPSVNNNIDSVYERNRNNPYDLFHAMFVYIEVAYEANSLEFARLKEIFDSLLQKDNLFNIWRHIFSISNSANILTHSHTLLNGYRILSNLFEGQVGEILPSSALYYQAISSSLLLFGIELIKDDSSSGSSAAYLHLLSRLPRECLIFFIQNLISIDVEGSLDSLLPLLSNEFSQEAAEISLRLISKLSSSLTYSNITIKYLIHRTCSSISVESFVQSFCVLRTFSDSAAEILIDSLPTHTVAPFCFALSQVWADIGLVVKGTGRARGYLTALLLRTLPKLSKEELTSVGHTSTRTPIVVVLSAGIGVYFDAADHGTRLLGKRVASQFAARLGTPLRFPELEEEERRLNVDLAVAAGDTELNGAKSSAVDAIAVEEKDEGEGGDDGDGDNDSELDAYLDEEEEPLQMSGTPSFPRVYYLSNCLQMLRVPESDKDIASKQRIALLNIPLLMRQQPSDASGLSGSILRELLCIHNSFNLDGFDAMRAAAIDAMLIHQPEHCVPILSWALGGDGLSLGIRVEVVAALVRAAYVLSNTPTSSQPEHQAKDDSLLPRIGSDYMVPNQDRSEKTVVRRPRRLAMLQKEVRFYTNRFVSVATAFYEATAAPVRSFIRSSPSPHLKAGTPDDIEEMLPSQALMALAAFIRCTANHYSVHAIMIKETLLLADALKIYSGIGIRRAALSALHACVEALVEGSRRGSSPSTNLDRARPASGALDALTHLALRDTESASLDSNTLQRTDAIIGIVNWCIDFFQTEADGDCRVLMAAIIRLMPSFSAGSKLVK